MPAAANPSTAKTEMLIELVRANPFIYDASLKENKDAVMAANFWKSAAFAIDREGLTGEVPICLTCHQRIHPSCTIGQTVLLASHYECQLCASRHPVVVCALCSLADSKDEILDGVLMCQSCSDFIHTPAKHHHRDHFYPVASPKVISVRGTSLWHNYLNISHEWAASSLCQPRGAKSMFRQSIVSQGNAVLQSNLSGSTAVEQEEKSDVRSASVVGVSRAVSRQR